MNRRTLLFPLLFSALMSQTQDVSAQTAPQIGYLFPAGAQRGTSVDIIVGGKYMPGPCGVWVGDAGVRAASLTTEGTIALTIDPQAEAGSRPVRIHSVQGGSSPRSFVIGELPEVMETADADRQAVSAADGITINGRLHPKGDIDQYDITLTTGQQVVCVMAMRSLGSPGDTVLRLIDSQGRVVTSSDGQRLSRTLCAGESPNRQGLDPFLAWTCPEAGNFTLQVYAFNFAGGADYVYRLTVTGGPYLDYAFPAGAQSGVESPIQLHGWNLPGNSLKHTVSAAGVSYIARLSGGANRLAIPLSDAPEILEHEPNDSSEAPQKIVAPCVVNGRFQEPRDADVFELEATKGDRLLIRIESHSLGFPADAVLQISNAEGKLVREIDDVAPWRDPEFLFAVAADGIYRLSLRERAGRGGPRFVYRLHIQPPRPSVRLTVKTSEFAVVPGETLTIPVRVTPLHGFAQELQLVASNLPAGVSVEAVTHTPAKAGDVNLEFKAAADAGFASGSFQIIARSTAGEESDEPVAVARLAANASATTPPVPHWLAVGPKVPFALSTTSAIQESPRLAAKAFPVKVTRDEGFRAPIRLVGVDPDRRGTVVAMEGQIAAESNTGGIPLIIQSGAVEGTTQRCRVMGVVDVTGPDGKQYPVFHIAKGSMGMGCQPNLLTLTASPTRIQWRPGQTTSVTLTIERRVACDGVTVSLLPHTGNMRVTAEPVMIAAGESQAEMQLAIESETPLPAEFTLRLQAETARAGLPIYAQTEVRIQTR